MFLYFIIDLCMAFQFYIYSEKSVFWYTVVGYNTPFSPLSQKEFFKKKRSPFYLSVTEKAEFSEYIGHNGRLKTNYVHALCVCFHPDLELFIVFLLFLFLSDKNLI